jgi:hypothetical protein
MEKIHIRISQQHLAEVKEFAAEGHKIKAIKHARNMGKVFPGREQTLPSGEDGINCRPGLREAKHAVEVLMGLITKGASSGIFVPRIRIKKVIVEGETGNIELDLDELQLRCLDGLAQGIPLSEVAAMTELITFVREWQGE